MYLAVDPEGMGGMTRNSSSLGDISTELPELVLAKSGYSEDNILAESEYGQLEQTVRSPFLV